MSEFDNVIVDNGLAFVFEHSGDAATYTPLGSVTPTSCTVVRDELADRIEERDGDRVRIRTASLSILRSDIDDPRPGGVVVIGSESWKIQTIGTRDASVTTCTADLFSTEQTSAPAWQVVGR